MGGDFERLMEAAASRSTDSGLNRGVARAVDDAMGALDGYLSTRSPGSAGDRSYFEDRLGARDLDPRARTFAPGEVANPNEPGSSLFRRETGEPGLDAPVPSEAHRPPEERREVPEAAPEAPRMEQIPEAPEQRSLEDPPETRPGGDRSEEWTTSPRRMIRVTVSLDGTPDDVGDRIENALAGHPFLRDVPIDEISDRLAEDGSISRYIEGMQRQPSHVLPARFDFEVQTWTSEHGHGIAHFRSVAAATSWYRGTRLIVSDDVADWDDASAAPPPGRYY